MKKIITLCIDETLKDRTKELSMNISGFLEHKLLEYTTINDPNIIGSVNQVASRYDVSYIPSFGKYKKIMKNV